MNENAKRCADCGFLAIAAQERLLECPDKKRIDQKRQWRPMTSLGPI
jgi:hypothetical protein